MVCLLPSGRKEGEEGGGIFFVCFKGFEGGGDGG